jgi:Ca-activated chloride channel family protein
MPLRMYGRYRTAGPATVRVQAEINGAALDQTVDVALPALDESNPEIERMWAWQKIDRLLKEADQAGSRSGAINEIVRLGEGYSIVTEYTSFLVLENDAEYQRWKIGRKNVLRLARDRKQQQVLQTELARVRERALADLGPDAVDANRQAAGQSPVTTAVPNASRPATQPVSAPIQSSERNLDLQRAVPSGGGGGGAFDPISGAIVLALAGVGAAAQRRRKIPALDDKKDQ